MSAMYAFRSPSRMEPGLDGLILNSTASRRQLCFFCVLVGWFSGGGKVGGREGGGDKWDKREGKGRWGEEGFLGGRGERGEEVFLGGGGGKGEKGLTDVPFRRGCRNVCSRR